MKKRTSITIHPDLLADAEKLMQERRYSSLSELLEALIREELRKESEKNKETTLSYLLGRHGPIVFEDKSKKQNQKES